ncbi:unnamed protein product [Sphagnum jensenii]|uniref:Tetratricopeptide repeat protein n=1 Tax=Sphagnum jensenii TaxID=128206 RepID=A0ABP0VU41_9BRYO
MASPIPVHVAASTSTILPSALCAVSTSISQWGGGGGGGHAGVNVVQRKETRRSSSSTTTTLLNLEVAAQIKAMTEDQWGQVLGGRRQLFAGAGLLLFSGFPGVSNALVAAKIDLSKTPSHHFDVDDQRLVQAATLFNKALSASTVEEEERLWTEVIDTYGKLDAEWVSDIVSRAWGNRGNARSRQGRMEEALGDFDHSIELAPYAADPVLNRGVVLESLGRYEEAASDYEAVLSAQPNDPAAWNNLGNVQAALRRWDEALVDYGRAVRLAPEFSFAAANYALALYQVGRENEAFKQFRSILRKYPEFPDVRAALAVSLYAQGLTAEAETNWLRMEDGRYRDRNWVRQTRRWPPRLVSELEAFLDLKSVVSS